MELENLDPGELEFYNQYNKVLSAATGTALEVLPLNIVCSALMSQAIHFRKEKTDISEGDAIREMITFLEPKATPVN